MSPTLPSPYFSSPFFTTFVTHPPNINEWDTVVTATAVADPDTPRIWNVHLGLDVREKKWTRGNGIQKETGGGAAVTY